MTSCITHTRRPRRVASHGSLTGFASPRVRKSSAPFRISVCTTRCVTTTVWLVGWRNTITSPGRTSDAGMDVTTTTSPAVKVGAMLSLRMVSVR